MAFRIYTVPIVTTVHGGGTVRTAKYVYSGLTLVMIPIAGADGLQRVGVLAYGNETQMLVGANFTTADDATLVSMPDVNAVPVDLDSLVTTGQRTAIQAFLESVNIPAGWIAVGDTWRSVARGVCGIFTFGNAYIGVWSRTVGGIAPSWFVAGVTLATTFGALPANVQATMLTTGQEQGLSTAGLTSGTTLRAILKNMADQYGTRQYDFNGTII